MRRRLNRIQQRNILKLTIVVCTIILVLLLTRSMISSSERHVVGVINSFYSFEQKGDFASSWALFHPYMKDKFNKGDYIQDRAHVFMNHFGVETFTFQLGKPKKLKSWKMSKDSKKLGNVYRVEVIQIYKGKYGNFKLLQDVFVVKEKEGWRVAWDYNR